MSRSALAASPEMTDMEYLGVYPETRPVALLLWVFALAR
jgi:hypothetical protein